MCRCSGHSLERRGRSSPLASVTGLLIQHELRNQRPTVEVQITLALDPRQVIWLDVASTAPELRPGLPLGEVTASPGGRPDGDRRSPVGARSKFGRRRCPSGLVGPSDDDAAEAAGLGWRLRVGDVTADLADPRRLFSWSRSIETRNPVDGDDPGRGLRPTTAPNPFAIFAYGHLCARRRMADLA